MHRGIRARGMGSTEKVSEAGGEEGGGGAGREEDPQNGSGGPALWGGFVEDSTADFRGGGWSSAFLTRTYLIRYKIFNYFHHEIIIAKVKCLKDFFSFSTYPYDVVYVHLVFQTPV